MRRDSSQATDEHAARRRVEHAVECHGDRLARIDDAVVVCTELPAAELVVTAHQYRAYHGS